MGCYSSAVFTGLTRPTMQSGLAQGRRLRNGEREGVQDPSPLLTFDNNELLRPCHKMLYCCFLKHVWLFFIISRKIDSKLFPAIIQKMVRKGEEKGKEIFFFFKEKNKLQINKRLFTHTQKRSLICFYVLNLLLPSFCTHRHSP